MKRRMEQLINGNFEYNEAAMQMSRERIDMVTKAGENVRGSFTIKSGDGKKVKGVIYSSAKRAILNVHDFTAREMQIQFEIDVTGLSEGEAAEGKFCISSSAGEYAIPWQVEIECEKISSVIGDIEDLEGFTRLANHNYQEAFKLFKSPLFKRLLTGRAEAYLSLYQGFSTHPFHYPAMEEFLSGTGQKERIMLSLNAAGRVFEEFEDSMKETISLIKSQWGYLQVQITADASFIEIEKKTIQTEDFIGSTCLVEYVIRKERLHGGRNFGRITFKSCYGILYYDIVVERKRENMRLEKHRQLKPFMAALLKSYIDFRLNHLTLAAWVEESERILSNVSRLGEDYSYFRLVQAQLYLAQKKYDEAYEILKIFEDKPRKMRTIEMRAYYSYLSALYTRNDEYTKEAQRFIYDLFLQHQESWGILWMRLFLDSDLKRSAVLRLDAIHDQFMLGTRSRLMYLEAYEAMQENPSRLKQLTVFETQVLLWAAKEELLEEAIVMQTARASMRLKNFNPRIFKLLTSCYRQFPEREVLQAICSLLIKGNKIEHKYFVWYARAVDEELRITRLYEHYVDSISPGFEGILPQMIRKYFAYNNTLSYQKKAFIYQNVITNREADKNTYFSYYDSMLQFAADQLAQGHINKNLGAVYEHFLSKLELGIRQREALGRALFTAEIHADIPGVRGVAVVHHQSREQQSIHLQEGRGYVQLYTKDCAILFMDEKGGRYAYNDYTLTPVMEEDLIIERYAKLAAMQPGVLFYRCKCKGLICEVDDETVFLYESMLVMHQITESFKTAIRRGLLKYYYEHLEYECSSVLNCDPYRLWIRADKVRYIELLIMHYQYREAFERIQEFGYEGLSTECQVKLASRLILQIEQEEDESLIAYAVHVFRLGKYDETLLSYLVRYYSGEIALMYKIWSAAQEFDIEAYKLEEEILVLLLFLRKSIKGGFDVFNHYSRHGGKKKVMTAYLIYEAFLYFVKEYPVEAGIFGYIENLIQKDTDLNEVCAFALLRFYAFTEDLDENRQERAKALLERFAAKGFCFGFYQRFPADWVRKYMVLDKIFIEYKSDPGNKITLHYIIKDKICSSIRTGSEPMNHLCLGIFSKQIILYENDEMEYWITEEFQDKGAQSESEHYTVIMGQNSTKKYSMLNAVVSKYRLHEETVFEKRLSEYIKENHLAENMFPLG